MFSNIVFGTLGSALFKQNFQELLAEDRFKLQDNVVVSVDGGVAADWLLQKIQLADANKSF